MLSVQTKNLGHSQTLLINEECLKAEQEGKTIYKFGFGQSPFSPPINIINSLKENAYRHEYMPVRGLPELRQAAVKFHNFHYKTPYKWQNTLIAPGSKILIHNVLHTIEHAVVILAAPSWVSYAAQASICGHKVVTIQTNFATKWHITAEHLDQASNQITDDTASKLLILNYPGNPDGMTYSRKELQDIAVVAKKHNIIIISDEIYALLNHQNNHTSIAEFYPDATLVSTGLSKWCGAGGWRLGVMFVPEGLGAGFMASLAGVGSETYSAATAPVQIAAIEAYANSDYSNKFISQQQRLLSIIGSWMANRLDSMGIAVHQPEGGFYLYPDFSGLQEKLQRTKQIGSSVALCQQLIKDTGVALLPGFAFGTPDQLLTARLCYVDFDGDQLIENFEEAIGQNNSQILMEKYCPKLVDGLSKLEQWLV